MSRFLSSRFYGLKSYVPGEQPRGFDFIKLNTNESPYPPSSGVLAAAGKGELEKLRLYADPECKLLREDMAALLKVRPENVFAGNGSDDVLSFCFMAFCDAKVGVSYSDITYGFYPVYAQLYGLEANVVPLREDFTVCADDFCGAGRTVVIANPNAPTGLCLPVADIEKIARANPGNVVVIDEAYVDFGGDSAVSLTLEYDNLLVVQTFSKSRSLAGARLGFAVGNAELIRDLEAMRYSTNPYNVSRLAQSIGRAAIADQSYYENNIREIVQTRDFTAKEMESMGFDLTNSKANFLFARHPKIAGSELYAGLRERGILVRHFSLPRISDYIRITVGTPEQMHALLKAQKEMVENA